MLDFVKSNFDILCVAVLALAAFAGTFCLAAPAVPDLILHHGKVVTVDSNFSLHAALAIRGDRIVQVGSDEQILKLKGEGTRLVDLNGQMVLPGLIDSHMHPTSAAMTEFDHVIPSMETIADVLRYILGRTSVIKEGEWIVVQQVFITRLRERRYPTRAELDQVAPRHPVVFRTGPDASLNTLALRRSGIGRSFKIPEGLPGRVETDAQGEPTGILRTFANYVKIPSAPSTATPAQMVQRLANLIQDYNSVGLTSICDRDTFPDGVDLYTQLRARGGLTARVSLTRHVDTQGPISNILQHIQQVASDPLFKNHDPLLRIIGIKTYLDGGMLTGSAYMREPWGLSDIYAIRDPNYRGTLFIPHERLVPMVRAAVAAGLQFTAHSVGDGAVHELLAAYEEVNRDLPVRASRPCISHANFMSSEAVHKLAYLGVSVDVQPAWLYLDTATLWKHFGEERLRWFQPLRSIFEAGGVAGGGSDHMQKIGSLRSINPYNPFLGMAVACTRQARWQEGALHPEESLTRAQAIRFYTINNAYILFLDDKVGSLEPGKLADLIVVDTDLLECPPEKMPETQVLQTYLGGKLIYDRQAVGLAPATIRR